MNALAGPASALRWPSRAPTPPQPWQAGVSVALHALAAGLVLGLLALPEMAPPEPDEGVQLLWQPEESPTATGGELGEAGSPAATQAAPEPAEPREAQPEQPAELPPEPVPEPAPEPAPQPEPQPVEDLPLPPPPAPPAPPLPQPRPSPPPTPSAPPRPKGEDTATTPAVDATPGGGGARVEGVTTEASEAFRPPQPEYPQIAAELGIGGTTRVRLYVNALGEVARLELLSSSGSEMLDRAAMAYFQRFRFRPARLRGEPVATSVTTALTWRPPARPQGGSTW